MNLFPRIADKIEREPALVRMALATVRKWIADGHEPQARLREWERILVEAERGGAGLQRLLALLRDETVAARRLKDFAPFPGILDREERRPEILSCSYDH